MKILLEDIPFLHREIFGPSHFFRHRPWADPLTTAQSVYLVYNDRVTLHIQHVLFSFLKSNVPYLRQGHQETLARPGHEILSPESDLKFAKIDKIYLEFDIRGQMYQEVFYVFSATQVIILLVIGFQCGISRKLLNQFRFVRIFQRKLYV